MAQRPHPAISAGDERPFVFVGTGHLAKHLSSCLAKKGLGPAAFCDNSRTLQTTIVDRKPVQSIEEAAHDLGQDADFVVTVYSSGTRYQGLLKQLWDLGVGSVMHYVSFMEQHADACLPFYGHDLPQRIASAPSRAEEAFLMLADELSRKVFLGSVRFRGLGDLAALSDEQCDDQYFPRDVYTTDAQDVFIDCGAYDGDTLRSFMVHRPRSDLRAYFGFEPDSATFSRLEECARSLAIDPERFELFPVATGKENCTLRFNADGTTAASLSATGNCEVGCVSLDETISGYAPTFIKLDIEGAEAETILGAKKLITAHSPIIAACVYHKPHDLWDLPLLIRDLNPSYTFFLRNHGCGGFELVLYAVPKHRLTGAV
jgi:FkbM family methyltransferase